jgi:hypothetical protein
VRWGIRDVVWSDLVWSGGEGMERWRWVCLFIVGIGSDFGIHVEVWMVSVM